MIVGWVPDSGVRLRPRRWWRRRQRVVVTSNTIVGASIEVGPGGKCVNCVITGNTIDADKTGAA